jgi:hypothetical protein
MDEKEWRVYFVRSNKSDKSPVKIGFTSDLPQRLIDLQCANYGEIRCLFSLPCESQKQARDLESFFHYKLKHCHVRGEWFDISNVSIPKIIDEFNKRKKTKYTNPIKKSKFDCPFKHIEILNKRIAEYEERIGMLEYLLAESYK